MTPDELRKSVLGVKRWSRSDQRAPNKPLMMAYVLAKYVQGHKQMFSYEDEVDRDLHALLKRFGPSRKVYHPEYPFWRLLNDGIWRLDNAEECLPRKSNTDPPKSELIKHGVTAGFSDDAFALLKNDTKFSMELLERILTDSFPESIIPEITAQLGLEFTFKKITKRDPNFRREVLRAYNYQCAVCGYDLRMDDISVGLEAAHIKWKQFHGPCDVSNGLTLCAVHHKAFDKGAYTITEDFKIKLSESLNGGVQVERLFFDFEGKAIRLPIKDNWLPNVQYLNWHQKEVFK
ncbi:phosphorothioated DNA-binding restriction endonuclease [Colwellia sp. TT2012]|uniref:phosphorothioated DNA-binding restriction endonuclease n=1 Tax=Colwellia sp. TT2012 TaxID=1720342 RepID=UPI00070951DE|nr:HNH endonuclease [Colwellia sp. TT2012]